MGTVIGGGEPQPLLMVKINFKLFVVSGSGDAKTLGTSPCT